MASYRIASVCGSIKCESHNNASCPNFRGERCERQQHAYSQKPLLQRSADCTSVPDAQVGDASELANEHVLGLVRSSSLPICRRRITSDHTGSIAFWT